jgi:hypothetical protein
VARTASAAAVSGLEFFSQEHVYQRGRNDRQAVALGNTSGAGCAFKAFDLNYIELSLRSFVIGFTRPGAAFC